MIEPKHVQPTSIFDQDGMRIHHYIFATGEGLLQHDHPCPHDMLVISGWVLVEIDGELQALRARARITFHAGVPHAMIAQMPSVVHTIFTVADALIAIGE